VNVFDRCPVVPVVVLDRADQALPLARALLAGGIDVIEVTLRTAAGLSGIEALAGLDEMLVGAGSVVTPEHVDAVVDAGAEFVVSPGTSAAVLQRSAQRGVPALPGTSSASDLMVCAAAGVTEVKVFPAALLGGPAHIAALAAPFPQMRFMPSGGVSAATMNDYLALSCVPAISGSWMVAPQLLREERWHDVTNLAAEAVQGARGALAA
jgi:2-dehydro-3-deoxyphosphogluconate aldolase/(4S)-4-hydroxy-2-oxoglutarate aldolase